MTKNKDSELYKWGTERREAQKNGDIPKWMTTIGYMTFMEQYLYDCDTYKEQLTRISDTLGAVGDDLYGEYKGESWKKHFFDILWKGWLAPSTPVMMNTGTDKGCSVSCSGGYVPDSVDGFFNHAREVALLSKNGFGTSGYVGDVRTRGKSFAGGGKADGQGPVIDQQARAVEQVRQPGRRGSGAWYTDLMTRDFDDIWNMVWKKPKKYNIGWNVYDKDIENLRKGHKKTNKHLQEAQYLKLVRGKGYYFFPDKANRQAPPAVKASGISIKNSNLCTEIMLPCDENYTFTCVLSSLNLVLFDEWKDTDAVHISTVFLDCVAEDFIRKGKKLVGLEKAVKFTEDFRALGLGVFGFHTYLQNNMISMDPQDVMEYSRLNKLNRDIFKLIDEQSLAASQWMAGIAGEPKWCKGLGYRNSHRTAIAPTMTTSLICYSVSPGVSPFYKNAYTHEGAGPDINRINPALIPHLKRYNKYTHEVRKSIRENGGSIQHLDFFTAHELRVFKTAFEIPQEILVRLSASRQPFICQGQSINLFFSGDEDPVYIAKVHQEAFNNENVLSLYYLYSEKGIAPSTGDCRMCD